MSDFLTRLAERAMGIAPAVQPKLPRRFAALPAPADASQRWWQEAVRLRAGAAAAGAEQRAGGTTGGTEGGTTGTGDAPAAPPGEPS